MNDLAGEGITFRHLPLYCLEKDGSWERLVALTKSFILSTLTKNCFLKITEEEMLTFFKEVQGILNWRPLTAVSNRIDDFGVLTPFSLCSGGLHHSVPPGKFANCAGIRKTWRTCHQLMTHEFWRDWSTIYLPTLIPRLKWTVSSPNFKVGDLVLLRESNLVRNL